MMRTGELLCTATNGVRNKDWTLGITALLFKSSGKLYVNTGRLSLYTTLKSSRTAENTVSDRKLLASVKSTERIGAI